MLPGAAPIDEVLLARLHRRDRHPVPEQPVRQRRLHRRDAGHGDRVDDDPAAVELILPYAGFLVSDPTKIEPLTGQPWNFWLVAIFATIGNTLGSRGVRHRRVRRPAVPRALWQIRLIRPHEIELADRFFAQRGAATVFVGRLLPIVGRSSASRPASPGCLSTFIIYSTAGAFIWSCLVCRSCSARTGRGSAPPAVRPGHRGRRRGGVLLFVWWRLGMRAARPVGRG